MLLVIAVIGRSTPPRVLLTYSRCAFCGIENLLRSRHPLGKYHHSQLEFLQMMPEAQQVIRHACYGQVMLVNANIDRWLEKLTKLAIHRTQGLNRRQQISRGRGRLPPSRAILSSRFWCTRRASSAGRPSCCYAARRAKCSSSCREVGAAGACRNHAKQVRGLPSRRVSRFSNACRVSGAGPWSASGKACD